MTLVDRWMNLGVNFVLGKRHLLLAYGQGMIMIVVPSVDGVTLVSISDCMWVC